MIGASRPCPVPIGDSHANSTWAEVPMSEKRVANYTTKQMGDACEMLVAAELTLAGVPALKMPDTGLIVT